MATCADRAGLLREVRALQTQVAVLRTGLERQVRLLEHERLRAADLERRLASAQGALKVALAGIRIAEERAEERVAAVVRQHRDLTRLPAAV